jgi:hypothetical protein
MRTSGCGDIAVTLVLVGLAILQLVGVAICFPLRISGCGDMPFDSPVVGLPILQIQWNGSTKPKRLTTAESIECYTDHDRLAHLLNDQRL